MTEQLARYETRTIIASFDDAERAARAMAGSGFFQDAKQANQAIVKILAGQELGFGPFASMTGVAIIQGKPAIGANLQAAAIKRTGKYNYRVIEMSDEAVELEFHEGGKPVGKSRFTMKDAAAAGLSAKDNWKKFPRNMLFARAISNGVKWYAPDIFNGATVYTPDELGANEDADGNVIDAPAQVVQPTRQPAPVAEQAEQNFDEIFPPMTGEVVTPLRYNPEQLRARIQELADAYAKSGKTANAGQRGLCAASLDQCFSDDTGDRHALNFYLTGKESSKDMTDAEILALLKWLEPTKDAAGKYWPNGMSVREANAAVRQAMTDKGQRELM